VAGVGPSLAKKIVSHRDRAGTFARRGQLLEVPGLGPRAFEQAAGFLRIHGGSDLLDASAVHPERYELVGRMVADLGSSLAEVVGNADLVEQIDIKRYVGDSVGEPTLRDIIAELKKPGRDPREEFEPPKFREDVTTMEDLAEGMQLEGVVTNVTAFGAFVDVGVHQDGLVHISELADRFVKDPKEVVRVGDKINVRVLGVDLQRKRISLSARSPRDAAQPRRSHGGDGRGDNRRGDQQRGRGRGRGGRGGQQGGQRGGQRSKERFSNNPFAKLGKLKK
jgi:uncharacterized protein